MISFDARKSPSMTSAYEGVKRVRVRHSDVLVIWCVGLVAVVLHIELQQCQDLVDRS